MENTAVSPSVIDALKAQRTSARPATPQAGGPTPGPATGEPGSIGQQGAPQPPATGVVHAPASLLAANAAKGLLGVQEAGQKNTSSPGKSSPAGGGEQLSEAEKKTVRELQRRDAEVRSHERAHKAAGGNLTGPANYTYVTGPDGKRYAVGGEVSIEISAEESPEATIRKMEQVVRAAMAPANPSSQDIAVANKARQMILEARAEQLQEKSEQNSSAGGENDPANPFAAIDRERASQAYALAAGGQEPQDAGEFNDADGTMKLLEPRRAQPLDLFA